MNKHYHTRAVGGVVIKDEKILLVRHTYGVAKDKLLVPGGFVNEGETPEQAVKREIFEETSVKIRPTEIIGVRFNLDNWYALFMTEYISGTPVSDNVENMEADFFDLSVALNHPEITEFSRMIVKSVIDKRCGFLNKIDDYTKIHNGDETWTLYLSDFE